MEPKSFLASKTLISSAIVMALPAIPGVKDIVASHPQESLTILGAVFAGLRLITKGKIDLNLPF